MHRPVPVYRQRRAVAPAARTTLRRGRSRDRHMPAAAQLPRQPAGGVRGRRGNIDDPARVAEQLAHYMAAFPALLDQAPFWTALLLRDHRDKLVQTAMEIWLAHVFRYARRDQLRLAAFHLGGARPETLDIDNHGFPIPELAPHRRPEGRAPLVVGRPGSGAETTRSRSRPERRRVAQLEYTNARCCSPPPPGECWNQSARSCAGSAASMRFTPPQARPGGLYLLALLATTQNTSPPLTMWQLFRATRWWLEFMVHD